MDPDANKIISDLLEQEKEFTTDTPPLFRFK